MSVTSLDSKTSKTLNGKKINGISLRATKMKWGNYNLPEVNLSRIIRRHERPVLICVGAPSHVGDPGK
jgi:hypothetical protein